MYVSYSEIKMKNTYFINTLPQFLYNHYNNYVPLIAGGNSKRSKNTR